MKGIIILGSSRSDGNTRQVAEYVKDTLELDMIDLNQYHIGYYDYNHDQKDDYISLMRTVVQYDYFIFATPVYWYSMSAVMKTFFDRFSDLVRVHRDLREQLRHKPLGMVCCGASPTLVEGFSNPFVESANYLTMTYLGDAYTWTDNQENFDPQSWKNLDNFINEVKKKLENQA